MTTSLYFIAGLTLMTFGIVIVFALLSKRGVEKRMEDPQSKPSSLAVDGPGPNAVKRINAQSAR